MVFGIWELRVEQKSSHLRRACEYSVPEGHRDKALDPTKSALTKPIRTGGADF